VEPSQKTAAMMAEAAQQKVWDSAEAASDETKATLAPDWNGSEQPAAGALMEAILSHVDLVDANYLVALGEAGGVAPMWQDVPACARINQSNVWRLRAWGYGFTCPVLVLSLPRLDPSHPDRLGEVLRKLLPLLRILIKEARVFGAHCTIGVLWDWMSLPQQPRSPAEEERFRLGLPLFTRAVAHPYTFVLLVTTPMPTGAEYALCGRPFAARGWCRLEVQLASLVKDSRTLWDFSLMKTSAEGEASVAAGAATDLVEIRRQMKAFRPPLASPDRFAKELREAVAAGEAFFDHPHDLEMAVALYEAGFRHAFETFVAAHGAEKKSDMVFYKDLGWGDADAPALADAIKWLGTNCDLSGVSRLSLNFRENEFTADGKAALEKAAEGAKKLAVRVHVVDEPDF
jgi:hypothetical protein